MDYFTAWSTGLLKSGSVVAFKGTQTFLDKVVTFFTGPYKHCAIIYNDNGQPMIYQCSSKGVVLVDFNKGYVPFDLIDTGVNFTPEVKAFADAQVGKSYSWFNWAFVIIDLNFPAFGYICSTLVGTILNKADESIPNAGLTPTALVNDLLAMKKPLITIDSPGTQESL
jgi:hypothetical protein